MSLIVLPYSPTKKAEWDAFVAASRNATFLFFRDFMDYHQHRFDDASLMIYRENGKLVGMYPASSHLDTSMIKSHGGLTYGGLLLKAETGAKEVLEMMQAIVNYYSQLDFDSLSVKPIPHIYHKVPSEEELYSLFRLGAKMVSRSASSTVTLETSLSYSSLRKRQYKKAISAGFQIDMDGCLADFWTVLTDTLWRQHQVKPVHSLAEIQLLKERFPEQMKCITVLDDNATIVGGTLLFCTPQTIHAQYIAATEVGRKYGALDFLFIALLERYKQDFATEGLPKYFDFGISTENKGQYLNEGLISQKEGFGARTTVYDEYLITLKP